MEYRKLISFGKNSFVISLPKSWVRQNNLQKGVLIYVEEQENNLLLSLGSKQETVEKVKEIPVDGKSVRRLKREIISAYIKDYKTIVLFGEELKDIIEGPNFILEDTIPLCSSSDFCHGKKGSTWDLINSKNRKLNNVKI